jgi:O-acetyl-ADP-ribose deacetylase (regulator of RNase III)
MGGITMIDLKKDDILAADVEALVNTVNCVGVMGRGIALQFRKAFPENFKEYQAVCERGELKPGKMLVHEQGQLTNPHYIINFPTKDHWKGKSRLDTADQAIEKTHAWSPRKQMFEPEHIRIAWNVLQQKGWLPQVR